MRGLSARIGANIATLAFLTTVVVGAAIVRFVGPSLFGGTYELVVEVPEAGGVLPGMPVTVLGTEAGLIDRTEVTREAVDIHMEFKKSVDVPATVMVHVLRRSPIGEQAIELTPVPEDWDPPEDLIPSLVPVAEGWEPADHGTRLEPKAVVTPSSVPSLLEKAEELLTAIPGEDLNTLIDELGAAVEGRVEVLRQLNRDSAGLGETLVGGIPDSERLLAASESVLAELSDHRETLAAALTDSADLVETLAGTRDSAERLLTASVPTVERLDGFIRAERANLWCLNHDFVDLYSMVAQDQTLEELERLLDLNRFFYGGFDAGTQWDPYRPGIIWARVNILFMEEAGGQPKVPRTPTPATKPGAACESPFGLGVDAVRQDDATPPDPTSPGIDYAPRKGGESSGAGDVLLAAAHAPETPRTGGGAGVFATAVLAGAGLLRAVRRRL
ncbi:MAG: hypothetical protein R3343_08380 [Nitriliruptorales bacterium]|nr:hypothetical protein [Nitriliruptorales bacterium]